MTYIFKSAHIWKLNRNKWSFSSNFTQWSCMPRKLQRRNGYKKKKILKYNLARHWFLNFKTSLYMNGFVLFICIFSIPFSSILKIFVLGYKLTRKQIQTHASLVLFDAFGICLRQYRSAQKIDLLVSIFVSSIGELVPSGQGTVSLLVYDFPQNHTITVGKLKYIKFKISWMKLL